MRILGHSSFCTNRHTLGAWERLLKAARDVRKLSRLILGSPSSSMGGAISAWSSCQEPWERDCFYFIVPISSLFFKLLKP